MNPIEKAKKQLEEVKKSLNSFIPTSHSDIINYEKMEQERQQREIMQSVERSHQDYQMMEYVKEENRKANRLHKNIETIAQEIKKKGVSQVSNTTYISYGDVKSSNITNVVGNDNKVNSEFNKKFNNLVEAINSSNIQDKELIIQELNNSKSDEKSFKKYLGTVLTKGAEFSSIVSAVSALLSL